MKLKLNGIEYTLNFGLGAFEIAEDRLDMSMDEVMVNLGKSKVYNNFVYSALLNALRIKDDNVEAPFGYHEFLDYVNQLDESINIELTKAVLNTTYMGKTFADRLGIKTDGDGRSEKKRPTKKREVAKPSLDSSIED